jgi:hypothetical protein
LLVIIPSVGSIGGAVFGVVFHDAIFYTRLPLLNLPLNALLRTPPPIVERVDSEFFQLGHVIHKSPSEFIAWRCSNAPKVTPKKVSAPA